jgi:methylthioribose-1-phosphate isomerase
MATMILQHKVRDYATWRPVYDAHEASRVRAGITNGRVYRNAGDANDIVILFDAADVAKARSWSASEDLATALRKAGVRGAPAIHFIG